jgi:hypothetical protein
LHSVERDQPRKRERTTRPACARCEVGRFDLVPLIGCGVRSVQRHTRTVASPQAVLPTRTGCLTSDGLGNFWTIGSAVGRRSVALHRRKRDSHCRLRDSAVSCRRWTFPTTSATSGAPAVKGWLHPASEVCRTDQQHTNSVRMGVCRAPPGFVAQAERFARRFARERDVAARPPIARRGPERVGARRRDVGASPTGPDILHCP